MRMNKTGEYEILDDGIFIQDPNTMEKMVFLLDRKGKVVLRSMLEEDIKNTIKFMNISSSEKRKCMKFLYAQLPKRGSEKVLFVAERIVETDCVDNEIYSEEREIIGYGARTENSIEIRVWKEEFSTRVLGLVTKLADYFDIQGEPYLQSVK